MSDTGIDISSWFGGTAKVTLMGAGPSKDHGSLRYYRCIDGWLVYYTARRAKGGEWMVRTYKPTGKGAHSGKAQQWVAVKTSWYKTHKTALKRAQAIVKQHAAGAKWVGTCPECGDETRSNIRRQYICSECHPAAQHLLVWTAAFES